MIDKLGEEIFRAYGLAFLAFVLCSCLAIIGTVAGNIFYEIITGNIPMFDAFSFDLRDVVRGLFVILVAGAFLYFARGSEGGK